MSIESDFTPPAPKPSSSDEPQELTFPLSTSLTVVFSPYEDRLVLRSRNTLGGPVNVLVTRRMTLIALAQLLASLPELSGLDKTPAQYWQEVLQIAHQNALESGREAGSEDAARGEAVAPKPAAPARPARKPGKLEGNIYLATAMTLQRRDEQLIMAVTGLPMPSAMTEPCERVPLFALPLHVEHVHQLIQLLIDKAREADWHLPVSLPWLESPPDTPASTLGTLH